jgi:uncharacterized membrane protein YeaQ/YmgE (transglycosylase-associated protein family)
VIFFVVLVLGLCVGWLAPRLLGISYYGRAGDLTTGVLGAFVGAYLAGRLLPGDGPGVAVALAGAALLGAVALVAAARAMSGGRLPSLRR